MDIRKYRLFIFLVLGVLFISLSVWETLQLTDRPSQFNGQHAYQDVIAQVAFGPRVPILLLTLRRLHIFKTNFEKQVGSHKCRMPAGWDFQSKMLSLRVRPDSANNPGGSL